MNRLLRCLAGAAMLSLAPLASADAQTAPQDLRLVFDIPLNHPRVPYFNAMAAKIEGASGGKLKVAANPGGTIHPGFASIEVLKRGEADLTFVNAANLERLDPRFGFVNLPFSLNDAAMASEAARRGVVDLLDTLATPQGLRVIGLMRGADQLFVFKDKSVETPSDLKGLKVRVAGAGIYQDIMTALSATPVVLPIPEMKPAFERGALDGVFTSPGAWSSQLGMAAPKATHAPGLMMITYVLVARKETVDRLGAAERAALLDAARDEVTNAWGRMEADDAALLKEMAQKGASIVTVTDLAPWRTAVAPIAARFAERYPQLMADVKARVGAAGK